VQAKRLLELGSGQTTKLLPPTTMRIPVGSSSARRERVLGESRPAEITRAGARHEYRVARLERPPFHLCRSVGKSRCRGTATPGTWRPEVRRHFVDGPSAPPDREARPLRARGFLQYLPGLLKDSFVVIVDDCDRYGEHATVVLLEKMLKSLGIAFFRFDVQGTKTQSVVCSPDRAFLAYV